MSDLIVIGFNDEFKADEVLLKLAKMQKEHLVDLEDAVVVVKNKKGKLKVKQTLDLVTAGAAGGSFWGLLIGLLFLHPLLGVTVGIVSGALSGALTDVGIDDDFIRELGKTLESGTSAIFILARKVTPDKVLEELKPFDGKVLRTSLSNVEEANLKAALAKAQTEQEVQAV
ncbi:DUF1269 domain-containing protein [Lyngbya aestuarii]|uniref:DUF1269 domain-containing protein n=1 Tax=Lyngbya aestuarii TaxID=118322 RepID=UPI00403DCA75